MHQLIENASWHFLQGLLMKKCFLYLHSNNLQDTGKKLERMNSKDAMMFPIIASVALFGLYIIFKLFSKDHINLLLTGYFFFLEVLALAHLLSPVIGTLIPSSIPNIPFHIGFTKGKGNQKQDLIDYDFSTHDIVCLIIALIIGIWYLLKKHWIANNLVNNEEKHNYFLQMDSHHYFI